MECTGKGQGRCNESFNEHLTKGTVYHVNMNIKEFYLKKKKGCHKKSEWSMNIN